MSDLVSIITPTYNCARFLPEMMESVMNQSYVDWELIIVDDCSTDETRLLVERVADSRIRYFLNDHRCGAALSRNFALRQARGRWVAFLDGDDVWHPHKLERQIAFMEQNGYAFSYTGSGFMTENSELMNKVVEGPRRISRLGMLLFCWPGCLSVMYDSFAVGLVQIVDIEKNNDYAMWLAISKQFDCFLLDENLATYRVRSQSISHHHRIGLIKWHYRLYRQSEKFSVPSSIFWTSANIFFGLFKKIYYTHRKNE